MIRFVFKIFLVSHIVMSLPANCIFWNLSQVMFPLKLYRRYLKWQDIDCDINLCIQVNLSTVSCNYSGFVPKLGEVVTFFTSY